MHKTDTCPIYPFCICALDMRHSIYDLVRVEVMDVHSQYAAACSTVRDASES